MGKLSNSGIAELLSQQAESAGAPLSKALRRAARSAFLWPVEAADLVAEEKSLTTLPSIGPYLEKLIRGWIERPPDNAEDLPPAIRRGFLSLPEARVILAARKRWKVELKGDLQMHTHWSDGSGTVLEMAQAASQRGYEYIAITDHSKGLKIAGGIGEDDLGKQAREIAEVNAALSRSGSRLQVLRSIELNLNPRGEGDMETSSLRPLDLVLGSFHSALRRTEDQTERYLAALRNPCIQILGHPQGRVYNYRAGLNADWPRVFALAAELDKAVEIDAYPDRQDLRVELLRLAKRAGCRISIGTDAHHVWQLGFIELGLAAACLAGIRQERILNYLSRTELLAWAAKVRDNGPRTTDPVIPFQTPAHRQRLPVRPARPARRQREKVKSSSATRPTPREIGRTKNAGPKNSRGSR
jgi:histidinol phosphatase-like PHP family hydrolase